MLNKDKKFRFIAVSYDGSGRLPYFEQAQTFMVYYLHQNKITRHEFLSLQAKDSISLASQFAKSSVDTILARNFSPRSMSILKQAGIHMATFEGGSDAAIKAYLSGELTEL